MPVGIHFLGPGGGGKWFEFICDGKVKLGRGTYAISTAILSMYADFQYSII